MRQFILIIFLINLTHCFLQTQRVIYDLTTNDSVCFQQETSSWISNATDPKSLIYSDCGGTFLMGGVDWSPKVAQMNFTFERLYQGIPDHKYIKFTFEFWTIDSWDVTDYFQLQFDSGPIFEKLGANSQNDKQSFCGNATRLDLAGNRVFGWIKHSSSSLLMQIISKMDQRTTDEAFGIRDIKLLLTDIEPAGSSFCANAGAIPMPGQPPCACTIGQYNPGSGCMSCHEDCGACYGAGSDSCYDCAPGRYFDGISCGKCHSGCSECSGPGENDCLKCAKDGEVAFHGKCVSETRCQSPMALDTCTGSCQSPCLLEDRDLWKENCFPPCPSNNIIDLQADCIYCESLVAQYLKVTDLGHQYVIKLYPASCDLDIETVRRYITIKEETKGTVEPFNSEITKTDQNQYFVNLVLGKTVLQPSILYIKLSYLIGTITVPKKFVPSPTLQEIAKMIPAAKSVLIGSLAGSFVGSLALGASTSLWSIISFQQFVGYFIYMNIEFPYQTELFLMLLQSSVWDMLPNPLSSLLSSLSESILKEDKNSVTIYDPPAKFVKYEMSSFFVENGGTIIAINLLLLVLLWFVIILRKTKYLKENSVLKKIEASLRWNMIARTFLENGIPLSLAIFLQLRIMTFNNLYLILCCAFAIFSFFYTFGATLALHFALRRKNNQELKRKTVEEVYGTLYDGLVLKSEFTKYYNLVILLRGILMVCLVAFWEAVPLFQIAPLILFNMCLVYYLFTHVPFEDKKLSVIVKVKEVLILLAECCIFCLLFGGGSESFYNFFGYLVLACLSLGLAIEFTYMFVLQIIELKNLPRNMSKCWQNIKNFFGKCLIRKNQSEVKIKCIRETSVVRLQQNQSMSENPSSNNSIYSHSHDDTIIKL